MYISTSMICSMRRHSSDVYLGMSLIQKGGSYLMYILVRSGKSGEWWRTGRIKGHGQAYFKMLSATML